MMMVMVGGWMVVVGLSGWVAVGSSGDDNHDSKTTHLSDPADVLVAVLLGEVQVLVQAEAHIVAVQAVRRKAQVQQVLLERRGNGRLARRRQAREPDGEARLLAQRGALRARQRRVPGDVAAACELCLV
jgi:hypothetical protein